MTHPRHRQQLVLMKTAPRTGPRTTPPRPRRAQEKTAAQPLPQAAAEAGQNAAQPLPQAAAEAEARAAPLAHSQQAGQIAAHPRPPTEAEAEEARAAPLAHSQLVAGALTNNNGAISCKRRTQ